MPEEKASGDKVSRFGVCSQGRGAALGLPIECICASVFMSHMQPPIYFKWNQLVRLNKRI